MIPQRRWMREAGQTALTGLLCGLMVLPQAGFAAQGEPGAVRHRSCRRGRSGRLR